MLNESETNIRYECYGMEINISTDFDTLNNVPCWYYKVRLNNFETIGNTATRELAIQVAIAILELFFKKEEEQFDKAYEYFQKEIQNL